MAWTAKKSGQQLQKHVLPRVAFGCSTVWEVLVSKSGGLGARKEKIQVCSNQSIDVSTQSQKCYHSNSSGDKPHSCLEHPALLLALFPMKLHTEWLCENLLLRLLPHIYGLKTFLILYLIQSANKFLFC